MKAPGHTWGTPGPVWDSPTSFHAGFPAMVVDTQATVHALIRAGDASNPNRDYYTGKSIAGGWSAPINISNSSGDTFFMWSEGMAVDQGGRVHVLWHDNTGSKYELYYRERSPDGVWSTPTQLK